MRFSVVAAQLALLATTCCAKPQMHRRQDAMGMMNETKPTMTMATPPSILPSILSSLVDKVFKAIIGAKGVPAELVADGILYQFDGCASSPKFDAFVLAATDALMDVTMCLKMASAAGHKYAGINGVSCYTSSVAGANTIILNSTDSCSTPCPGNAALNCGGTMSGNQTMMKRQNPGVLLSLYEAVGPAPPAATTPPAVAVPVPVATPAARMAGDVYVNVTVINYIGLCGCAEGLGRLSYTVTQTLTACGCEADNTASIPHSTTTTFCANCGPSGVPSTVTLTVPVGAPAAVTGTAVPTKPFTGAASSSKLEGMSFMIGALTIVGVALGCM